MRQSISTVRTKSENRLASLEVRLKNRTAHIAVLGLGYAGLPMAVGLAKAGFSVTGLDVDDERVCRLNNGKVPSSGIDSVDVAQLIQNSRLRATVRFEILDDVECALICVPTPLTSDRRPDLRHVEDAARSIAAHLRPDTLVVLQSTCGPGTTRQVVLPILESSGLGVGKDFYLAFASERIDPGNRRFNVWNTPKVVGGITPSCGEMASLLFGAIVEQVVRVASPEVAETSKLVENTFRFINISFINEMAVLCDRLGISIWEVIEAASTKPFAFMPHFPGPGVGGHCIPVVPFFLEAAAHDHGMFAGLIEAAGRVNDDMPRFVVDKLERLLAERGRALREARVLVLGLTYKPNVSDLRGSPALLVVENLLERGSDVVYHDPYVANVTISGVSASSLPASEIARQRFDCAILLTPHDGVDYSGVARQVGFMFDTRAFLSATVGANVVRL